MILAGVFAGVFLVLWGVFYVTLPALRHGGWLIAGVVARNMRVHELVTTALQKQREIYRADPGAASKAIRFGESQPKNIAPAEETAAWTMIANLILNLDETVCRN